MFFIKVCIYFCWFALAATFGLMRYSALGCQVVERYSGRRSHNWARIVAICMMVAVELMHWRSMHGLMLRWNMGEDAIFFTLGLLAIVSYGSTAYSVGSSTLPKLSATTAPNPTPSTTPASAPDTASGLPTASPTSSVR